MIIIKKKNCPKAAQTYMSLVSTIKKLLGLCGINVKFLQYPCCLMFWSLPTFSIEELDVIRHQTSSHRSLKNHLVS